MAHSIKYHPEENVIKASVIGLVNVQQLLELVEGITQVVKEENCTTILTDLREAELNISITETYFLPQKISEIITTQGLNVFALRRAFIAPKDHEIISFYEMVSRNKGNLTKLFHTSEEADAWSKSFDK